MAKRVPTPEGSVLHFYRNGKGKTELEVAERVGVTVQTIRNWESGRRPLPQVKLEEVLGAIDVPPAAVAEALLAHRLGTWPEEPGSFAAPSGQVGRLIHQAAAAAGTAAAATVRTRLIEEWRQRLAQDHRRWAEEQWAKIQKLKPEKQEMVLGVLLDERNWALAERIAHASEAAAVHKADSALRLAHLAIRVAERLPGPESRRLHTMGYCKDFGANAFRVGGDHRLAEGQFLEADEFWKAGTASDLTGILDCTRRLDLKASLFMFRERLEESVALLDRGLKATQDEIGRVRLLIKKAMALGIAGEHEAAISILKDSKECAERTSARMLLSHRFETAVQLCHLERHAEAEPLLAQLTALAGSSELAVMRIRWLEGRVYSGLGHHGQAVVSLSQVHRYFGAERIDYDFAIVSLELSILHLKQRQTGRVQELAEQMLWIFERQKIHREALAALALFRKAVREHEARPDWLDRLIKYLYRAQHRPSLQFEA